MKRLDFEGSKGPKIVQNRHPGGFKVKNFQNNKNQNKSYLINLYQKIKTSINKFRLKDPNVADRKKVI